MVTTEVELGQDPTVNSTSPETCVCVCVCVCVYIYIKGKSPKGV